jgi:hypothetical protein
MTRSVRLITRCTVSAERASREVGMSRVAACPTPLICLLTRLS